MSRKWTLAVLVVLAIVAVVGVGCGKKAPKTVEAPMAPEPPAPPPPREIEDTPAPVIEDRMLEGMDLDLVRFNEFARERGLIGDVYFDFDKYDLKPEARDRLAKNADFMRKYETVSVTVEGHCDERGTNEYNIALGDRRANAAADYMASLGISGSRMRTVSYGEESPVCREHNEGCWYQNRRARFVITGK